MNALLCMCVSVRVYICTFVGIILVLCVYLCILCNSYAKYIMCAVIIITNSIPSVKGFYTTYRRVFEKVSAEDSQYMDQDDEPMPTFGGILVAVYFKWAYKPFLLYMSHNRYTV